MKLHVPIYKSPIATEGTFENVFIEETMFSLKRMDKYFPIEFEMYYLTEGKKVVLDTFKLAFLGMNDDAVNSNRKAVISMPNPDYDTLVAAIPTEIEAENPDYDSEVEGSQQFIIIPNPAYAHEVSEVPKEIEAPLLEHVNFLMGYMYANDNSIPEGYEVVDWGYPTFEDVMQYFVPITLQDSELNLNNPFAEEWLKHNVFMKGRTITEFNFVR